MEVDSHSRSSVFITGIIIVGTHVLAAVSVCQACQCFTLINTAAELIVIVELGYGINWSVTHLFLLTTSMAFAFNVGLLMDLAFVLNLLKDGSLYIACSWIHCESCW